MWKAQNCQFTKTILTVGEGFTCPVVESTCQVRVKEVTDCCKDLNGLSDSLTKIGEFHVGWSNDGTKRLLENLVVTMKKGEVSSFVISIDPSLDLTSSQILDDAPSIKPTIGERNCSMILELLDFDDVTPLWELSDKEKYDFAVSHKNEGTKYFLEANFQAAFFQYSLSARYLISISLSDDIDSDEKHKLLCICYMNLAACQLKYNNYQSVISNCSKALNFDGKNVKALYRRAAAYKELGRKDEARLDLLRAKKHEPRNRAVYDLLQSLTLVKS